jgi:hypothetical protein
MSRHEDTVNARFFGYSFFLPTNTHKCKSNVLRYHMHSKCTRHESAFVLTRAVHELKHSQSERPGCLSLLDLCVPPTVLHYCSSPTRRASYDRFLPCERISPHGLSIVVGVSCDLAVGHAEFLAILHQRFAVPACSVHDAVRVCALTTSEVWSSQRPVSSWGLPLATAHKRARTDEHAQSAPHAACKHAHWSSPISWLVAMGSEYF